MSSTRKESAQRPLLATRLLAAGIIEPELLDEAVAEARSQGIPLVRHLLDRQLVPPARLADISAETFGLKRGRDDQLNPDPQLIQRFEPTLLRRHQALPLNIEGEILQVAVSDPANVKALDALRLHTGYPVEPLLVADDVLIQKLNALSTSPTPPEAALEIHDGGEAADHEPGEFIEQDTPVIRYANQLLNRAIREQASDVHIEPNEDFCRIRFRRDGMLHEIARPPLAIAERLTARLKVMARMDIAERRIPQDGRLRFSDETERPMDFRVSSLPTLHGEKLVLRLLDPTSAQLGLEKLGLEAGQLALLRQAIAQPHGMLLVTGPTGSGKTVTLYSALQALNTPARNLLSVEDPVEIRLPGINQVAINPRAGLDFPNTLRAFLRQDPDIMMVGEIRDRDTAEIAIKAAQTGHLVLSTLHTNSAVAAITRLANMGIPGWNIAACLCFASAQRLARKLCDACKRPASLPEQTLREAGFNDGQIKHLQLFEPVGCPRCLEGYRGRVGIHETLAIGPSLSEGIIRGGSEAELIEIARQQGFRSLREMGLEKAAAGITSLAEIDRITRE